LPQKKKISPKTIRMIDKALEAAMLVIADREKPIALAGVMGGLNLYAYVGNSPVNRADALGLTESTLQIEYWDTVNGVWVPMESHVDKNLRDAGAVIIAKTGMTELANWVAAGMPGNYNGLSGYGMNPYDPRRDPRPATFDGRPALVLLSRNGTNLFVALTPHNG
jgi:hypothetical protein